MGLLRGELGRSADAVWGRAARAARPFDRPISPSLTRLAGTRPAAPHRGPRLPDRGGGHGARGFLDPLRRARPGRRAGPLRARQHFHPARRVLRAVCRRAPEPGAAAVGAAAGAVARGSAGRLRHDDRGHRALLLRHAALHPAQRRRAGLLCHAGESLGPAPPAVPETMDGADGPGGAARLLPRRRADPGRRLAAANGDVVRFPGAAGAHRSLPGRPRPPAVGGPGAAHVPDSGLAPGADPRRPGVSLQPAPLARRGAAAGHRRLQ